MAANRGRRSPPPDLDRYARLTEPDTVLVSENFAALYAINLPGTWIYDDVQVVRDDPRLHDPHLWGQFFTNLYVPDSADNLWRPLTNLSYAFQWWLHGERAWPFHLVNLLLHAVVAAQVAELGRRLTDRRGVGFIAGLLFETRVID